MFKFSKPRNFSRSTSPFQPTGFHGDRYLLTIVDFLLTKTSTFVETGTNVGSTLSYVARKYPNIKCLSCEPDHVAFANALQNTKESSNVNIFNETSQKFLKRLSKFYPDIFIQNTMFWLDAHGYGFEWPLREEIYFITRSFSNGYILIDDFKIPEKENFGFDKYGDQECSFDYIRDAIKLGLDYHLYYPSYSETTSSFHSLRGWGLIDFGHSQVLNFPDSIKTKITLSNNT